MAIDSGGAAFPSGAVLGWEHFTLPHSSGMALLDYFAAGALPKCLQDAGENAGAVMKKVFSELSRGMSTEQAINLLKELQPTLDRITGSADAEACKRAYKIAAAMLAEKRRREGESK